MRPVYVYGSRPAYFQDSTETGVEQVALHQRAIAVHQNAERREQIQAESERLAALPPSRAWFEEQHAEILERLDEIEAALGIRELT